MTNLMRCVRFTLVNAHTYSKRPLGSQITINFHRSLYEYNYISERHCSFPLSICVIPCIPRVRQNPYRFICRMFTIHRGEWNHTFLPCVALHTFFYTADIAMKYKNRKDEKKEKKISTMIHKQKWDITHGRRRTHAFIFTKTLLIVSFYLFFGAFLLNARQKYGIFVSIFCILDALVWFLLFVRVCLHSGRK